MKNNITFGKWETAAVIINSINVQIILNFPRLMVEVAGSGGWIIAAYVSLLAFIGFLFIRKLYSKFEGMDLLDIGDYIGGNIGRIAVGLILLIHFTFAAVIILREFCEDMKIIALTNTPISFVALFFITEMIFASYLGLESIVRITSFLVPIVVAAYLLIILLITPFYDMTNLFPMFATEPLNVFKSGSFRVSSYSALILLPMFFPFIKTNDTFKRVGFLSIGIASLLLVSSTLAYVLVFRYNVATENFLPIFQLARLISYGRFFQRIESVFLLAWALSAFMYLSVVFFFIIYMFKKIFRLEYLHPLIWPFATIIFCLSLLPQNLMAAVDLETRYFRNTAWLVTFVMTIILLFIAGLKKNFRMRSGEKS